MSSLPSSIASLSVAEKCDLLDLLWQDIESQSRELTEEQVAELDRREARYRLDPESAIPWEQVKARYLR